MSTVPITYLLTENYNITNMRIDVTQLILFSSAQFRITFYDENNNIVKCQILMMSGTEYQFWEGNDTYVVQWVKTQLGIL